jgi:hypothetical protein
MVFYLFVIYKANIEVYGILFPIVDLSYAKASNHAEENKINIPMEHVKCVFILMTTEGFEFFFCRFI